jgi:NitT/TauT family transport system ATP-binding protein
VQICLHILPTVVCGRTKGGTSRGGAGSISVIGALLGAIFVSIEFKNVSKTYPLAKQGDRLTALNEVSFSAELQEFVCLLGPSGCGKSTLLKMAAGLETAESGTVTIDDETVLSPRKGCGMVFQDYALYPWLTVEQNVSFGLELRGDDKSAIGEAVARFIGLVGLLGFEKSFPHQLSGGMKQRVALARVLVMSPKVLLMDEPFGALDSFTRMEMQTELINLWRQQPSTVLFVTHDIEEAVYLADRIVVMTPRPGQVKTIADVPLSRPRRRTDPHFSDIRNYVLEQYERSDSAGVRRAT